MCMCMCNAYVILEIKMHSLLQCTSYYENGPLECIATAYNKTHSMAFFLQVNLCIGFLSKMYYR